MKIHLGGWVDDENGNSKMEGRFYLYREEWTGHLRRKVLHRTASRSILCRPSVGLCQHHIHTSDDKKVTCKDCLKAIEKLKIFIKTKRGRLLDVSYYRERMQKNVDNGYGIFERTPIGKKQDGTWFWREDCGKFTDLTTESVEAIIRKIIPSKNVD